jgi:hypothetical protein
MSAFLAADDAAYAAATVAYTGTAGSTATFQPGANAVLVWCTTAAYVKVGVGVTATTASTPLPANTPIVMRVPESLGAPWRVSAIQVASGGNVYAKPGMVVG